MSMYVEYQPDENTNILIEVAKDEVRFGINTVGKLEIMAIGKVGGE
jgi:hypothetical protein